jgi:hypothetical protein
MKKDTKDMEHGGADERSTTAEWTSTSSSTTKLHKFVGRNKSKANRSLSIIAFLVNPPFPPGKRYQISAAQLAQLMRPSAHLGSALVSGWEVV